MPQHTFFRGGDWNAVCDQCGRTFKASQMGMRWDNAMVCLQECMETRNPQDFVKAVDDDQSTPWVRQQVIPTNSNLALPVAKTDVLLSVVAGDGAKFPSPGAGQIFFIAFTSVDGSLMERVAVGLRAGDILVMVGRPFAGNVALPWAAGTAVIQTDGLRNL